VPIEASNDAWHDWCESREGQGIDRNAYNATWAGTTIRYYDWSISSTTGTIYNWPVNTSTGNYPYAWTPLITYTYTYGNNITTYANNDDGGEQWRDRERQSQQRATARVEAMSRAEKLLLEMLSQSQRERYRLVGEFEVMGSAGNLYRIKRGVAGNIEWIKPDGGVGVHEGNRPPILV
jgi:hypothetical protein